MNQKESALARGGNRLLARLPEGDYRRLQSHLEPVPLRLNQVLYEARGPIEHVYFPDRSVLWALTIMADGSAIEVGTIEREGAAGLAVLTGPPLSVNRVIVQVADGALRIKADALRDAASPEGPLRQLLLDHQAAFFAQVSQSVACNGLHPVQKRCCRWLLMTHDRVESDVLPLTHEFLAMMLGVRRAGVTEVLQSLQEQGWVRYSRGRITVLDRPGLEAGCCECYRVVRDEYERLLG